MWNVRSLNHTLVRLVLLLLGRRIVGCQLDYPQMATIMLTLHGFLLTSCILLSAKTTILLTRGNSLHNNDGDIITASVSLPITTTPPSTTTKLAKTIADKITGTGGGSLGNEVDESSVSITIEQQPHYHQRTAASPRPPGSVNKTVLVSGLNKCPVECTCGRDNGSGGLLEVLCLRGNSNKSWPMPTVAVGWWHCYWQQRQIPVPDII